MPTHFNLILLIFNFSSISAYSLMLVGVVGVSGALGTVSPNDL